MLSLLLPIFFACQHWLLFVVVLCPSLLVSCVAAQQPTFRPPLPSQVRTENCGDLRIQFTLSYAQDGTPTYTASIRDSAGQPPTAINRVLFAFTPLPAPGKPMGSTTTLVASPRGEGRYQSSGGFRLNTDAWQAEVIVRQSEARETVCAFSLSL